MNSKILILLLSANLAFLAACTKKGDPIQQHEGVKQTRLQDQDVTSNLEKQFEAWDLQSLYTKTNHTKQADEKTFNELAVWVLNVENLKQPRITNKPKWQQALTLLNWTVLASKKLDPALRKKWLALYEAAALEQCHLENKACPNLKWFSKDGQSALILAEIAQGKSLVREYYMIMSAAYDISNLTRTQEFMNLFQQRSQEYISELEKSSDPADKQLLSQHKKAVSVLRESREEKVSYNDFKSNLGKYKSEVSSLQNDLKKNFAAGWDMLGLQDIENPESVAAFHAFFSGKLDVADFDKFLADSKFSDEALKKSLVAYLQIQFSKILFESNRALAESIDEKEFNADTFFDKMLLNTNSIGNNWRIFISKTDRANEAIHTARHLSSEIKTVLGDKLTRIRYNIKLYSLYPHMLAMSYYVAKYSIVQKFNFFMFTFTKSSDELVTSLMFPNNAYSATWFDYGTLQGAEDKIPFKKIEMIDSFEMGMRSGLFDEMKIDSADFLNRIFRTAFKVYVDKSGAQIGFEPMSMALTNTLENSLDWKTFTKQCEQITSKKPILNEISISEIIFSPTLGNIKKDLTNCNMGSSGNLHSFQGTCPITDATDATTETLRSGVKPALLYANLILKSYKEYLKRKNLPAEQSKALFDKASQPVKELRTASDKFLDLFGKKAVQYTKCFAAFTEYEENLNFDLVDDLDLWIRDFYKKIKSSTPEKAQQDLRQQLSKNGYSSIIEVSNDKFKFSKFDILMKIVELANKRVPGMRYTTPVAFTDPEITKSPSDNYFEVIDLNLNEDQFTQKMLVRIFGDNRSGGWLYWFAGNYAPYKTAVRWEASLAILHRIDAKKFDLDLLLSTAQKNFEFSHLTDRKITTLKKLNRTSAVDSEFSSNYDNLYINPFTNNTIGFYDRINDALVSDILAGFDWGPNSDPSVGIIQRSEIFIPIFIMPALKEAREYAQFDVAKPKALFSISERNSQIYKNYYRIQVDQAKKIYNNFRQRIAALPTPTNVRIRTYKSVDVPKLSAEEINRFDTQIADFNRMTADYYIKSTSPSATEVQSVEETLQAQELPAAASDIRQPMLLKKDSAARSE